MRIRTLGGLWIEGEPAPSLGPRRMALLALVAASGRRGTSRDRVLGILWPEAEEEQARHSLSQALYSLKRDTGREWIAAGPDLRLDPAIASDVGDLHDALAADDPDAACALYGGEFLAGFYLAGTPEFERWVEEERARIRGGVIRAAERGAARAEKDGDRAGAIRLRARLAELDPLAARHALALMRTLAASGDRAGALEHARRHEALVRRELEADVDPAIRALAGELRAAAPAETAAVPMRRRADAHDAPHPGHPRIASLPSRRAAAAVAILAALAALATLAVRTAVPRSTPVLAVGSIRIAGQADTAALGPVLRDMLATGLGSLEGLRVIANSRLVELTPPGREGESAALADAARRAGASEVIEGELAGEGSGAVLTLRRVDLASGVVRKGYVARAADRYGLVDSAAALVARDLGVALPTRTVGDLRTTSPEAYLLYTEALRAYYGFDGPAAYRLMKAALERDSTFAMAAYYAMLLGHDLADPGTRKRETERVRRLAPRTIERERLLLQAELARRESSLTVMAAIVETLTVRYPDDPDGQFALASVRHGQGDYAGAIAAFERSFALDSAAGAARSAFCRMCSALGNVGVTYLWWDSASAAERTGRRIVALWPDEPRHLTGLVEPLLRQGRRAEAEEMLERSGILKLELSFETHALQRDLIRWGRFEELDRRLGPQFLSASPEARGGAGWLLLMSLRDQGRNREARALALEGRVPGTEIRLRGTPELVLSATMLQWMGRPDSAARLLEAEAERFLRSPDHPPGQTARAATWRLTLAGTAWARAGDTAAVRRLVDTVQALGAGSVFGRDPLLHHHLRGLLLQAEGRHAEATREFRRAIHSLTDGYTETNLVLARSLLALGRPGEAIAVLRPAIHGGVDGSNTYTSRTELHEAMAQAFEQAGLRDSAVAHHRAVERAWRRADPELRARWERARTGAR